MTLIRYLLLGLLVFASIGPFLWLLSTALKGSHENLFSYPPSFFPESPSFENFRAVLQKIPFHQYLINSVVVAVITIGLNLSLSTLAAYPLARLQFKGKSLCLMLIVSTMFLPFQVLMIPLYLQLLTLGLHEGNGYIPTWLGLALPFAISGFGVLFMRQAFVQIPSSLDEAASLDGASPFQTLVYILLPLLKPSLITLAIFTLMASWGEFLWPSILLSKDEFFTLPVGLVQLQGHFHTDWRLISAGTLLAMLPTVVVFFILQRYFMQSSLASSIKG